MRGCDCAVCVLGREERIVGCGIVYLGVSSGVS